MSNLSKKISMLGAERYWSSSQSNSFHECTKFTPASVVKGSSRIVEYMFNPRYILETARNVKLYATADKICLPDIEPISLNLTALMHQRESCRTYSDAPATLQQVSNIFGRSAVVTRTGALPDFENEVLGMRPYPSGGGLYPCELYLIALNVDDLARGIYHYDNFKHVLQVITTNIAQQEIDDIFMADAASENAAFIIVTTAIFERTVTKYQDRGYRIALLEAGHIAQNLIVAGESEQLGTLAWGGFYDDYLSDILQLDSADEPPVHSVIFGVKIKENKEC